MIYAEEVSLSSIAGPPAGPFAGSDVVHFSGMSGANGKCGLSLSSLSCTNNGYLGWAGWFKTSDWYPGSDYPNIFMVDSTGIQYPCFLRAGTTQWEWDVGNGSHSLTSRIGNSDSTAFLVNNNWTHIIAACDVNQTSGNKKFAIYVNDVTAGFFFEAQVAWSFAMNGKNFFLGDSGGGISWQGDMADFSFWPGVNLLTAGDISLTTRRLFIDDAGGPVAPSVAIAALGSPAVMCTGGLSGFLANSLGTSGTLSVPGGYDSPT